MQPVPYIDIHTHPFHDETETVTVQNIYPGDGFAAFNGRNFYSVGLHPWHVSTKQDNNEALQMVEEALEFDHVIFVGETGLDKLAAPDFKEQSRVFEAQAYMAEEYEYPLIVHCVKAFNEVVELRKRMSPAMPWIMHGYNGSLELTKRMSEMGFLFSFGESIFIQNSKGMKSLKYLPLNKLFFETDESRVEVGRIYEKAAALKNISLSELKNEVWKNFNKIENTLSSSY